MSIECLFWLSPSLYTPNISLQLRPLATSAIDRFITMTSSLINFHFFSTIKGKLSLILGTVLGLIAGYFLAPVLPPVIGWENGLLENTQVVILLFGGYWAFKEARSAPNQTRRVFWWVITPIWFVIVMREISWGAGLLMPIYIDPVTGPAFSSTQQLFYKPLVAPVLMAMVALQIFAALRWRIDKLITVLWQAKALPILEMSLVVICALVSTAAESHMGLSIPGMEDKGSLQLLEEWAELLAYSVLFAAQARVILALRSNTALGSRTASDKLPR